MIDDKDPGQYQSSTDPWHLPILGAWGGSCVSAAIPTTPRSPSWFSQRGSNIPCEVSGTHLHGSECPSSILHCWKALQRRKVRFISKTEGRPRFHLWPCCPLRPQGQKVVGCSLLQLCPELWYPSNICSALSFQHLLLSEQREHLLPGCWFTPGNRVFSTVHRVEDLQHHRNRQCLVDITLCSLPAMCLYRNGHLNPGPSRVSERVRGTKELFKCLDSGHYFFLFSSESLNREDRPFDQIWKRNPELTQGSDNWER